MTVDRLADYIPVADRITNFYVKFPDGALQSEIVEMSDSRVVIRAYAYRTADDPRPGMGHSSMPIPAKNQMLRDSEIEVAETSAWGRAIAALGFDVKKGVASRDEITNKSGNPDTAVLSGRDAPSVRAQSDGLVGTVELAKDSPDFLPHVGPDGPVLSFKLVDKGKGIKVIAVGPMAEVLTTQKDELVGQRVTCWGRVKDETFRPKGSTKDVTYQVLALERIQTPTFTLPAPGVDEPPEDVELIGEADSMELELVG